jgi:hypothetical protein
MLHRSGQWPYQNARPSQAMNYSDEPNVISEQKRSKKVYFLVGGFALFFLLLASVAMFPRLMDYQRKNTPVGPNQGNVYFINLGGDRFSFELARNAALDFHLHVFLRPVRDNTTWQPEDYTVRLAVDDSEAIRLQWAPEVGAFGPSELRFHPQAEFRFRVEIIRDGTTVWSGRRWSFREGSGHSH